MKHEKGTGREHFQELNMPKACSVNEDVQKHRNIVSYYLLIKQGPEHGERNVQEHHPCNHLNLRDEPLLQLEGDRVSISHNLPQSAQLSHNEA